MTDDLKSRLRKLEGGDKYGSTVWHRNPDGPEAVDLIEKLEAANLKQSLITVDHLSRIEKLEAALRFYICGCDAICANFKNIAECGYNARRALEGKDD